MIQTKSLKNCPSYCCTLPSPKILASAVILGLVFLSSACQFNGGAVSLVPGPSGDTVNQRVSNQAVQQQSERQTQVTANTLDPQELIAADMVNAIVQIEKLHPSRVTLHMTDQPDAFGPALKFVLEQAGYNFSSFPTGTQDTNVTVILQDIDSNGNGLYRRYQINIGEAKFRREYFIQPQGVTPSSDLLVKGVDASRIVLNEGIFEDGNGPAIQTAALVTQETSSDTMAASPGTPHKSAELPALATAAAISPQHDHDHDDHSNEQHAGETFALKQNRFALGHSNFAKVTENFIDVKSQVLVFANDSLNLGRRNKATVLAFAEPFIEESDVISIVGCSHGRTKLRNGNVVLATGRTQRVKEALLIAGIAEDRILDEGCWSATDDINESHPRRGVTVTLKRERRNG